MKGIMLSYYAYVPTTPFTIIRSESGSKAVLILEYIQVGFTVAVRDREDSLHTVSVFKFVGSPHAMIKSKPWRNDLSIVPAGHSSLLTAVNLMVERH